MGAVSRIGRYEVVGEIGRGAMGVVYEARDPMLDRIVALKVIQPAAELGELHAFEERFLAEARIAAALQHPGIVVVHEVDRDPASGALFIALELLRGRTLADLASDGPLDWREAMRIVAQVARALHHAHGHGVVHRDIKPANVIVLPTGEVKVTDFGIARLESARQRLTSTGEFIGTPLYTAPEQARVEDVDGRTDVFSLASVAYALVTGKPAFLAPSIPGIVHRVVYEDPMPPSTLVPGLPADVERVLTRALVKDPAGRYATAAAFAEDAEDVLAGRPPRHAGADDLVVVDEAVVAVPAHSSIPPAAARTRTAVPRRGWPSHPPLVRVLVAVVGIGLLASFLWLSRRASQPATSPRTAPTTLAAPAPSGSVPALAAPPLAGPVAAPATPASEPPGRLRIDFDHPLERGRLRIFVDDELALEQRIAGQRTKKALVFPMHEGSFREELDVPPGLHEVRVEVRWDDNVKNERIVGSFRSGAIRRLDANLGRIRRDLTLEWR